MKLEIKHIAPYLPYGLKAKILDYKSDYVGREIDSIIGIHQWSNDGNLWSVLTLGGAKPSPERTKPLLRPISQLYKKIEINGEFFIPMEKLSKAFRYTDLFYFDMNNLLQNPYDVVKKLLEFNFDIFGLIEAGLAIEITEP